MTDKTLPPSIQAYFEAISDLNFTKASDLFSEPCHHEDPVGGPVNYSPAEVKKFLDGLGSLFVAAQLFPREIHGQGSEWAIPFRCEGRGRNGTEVAFEGVDTFRLDSEGHIVELRAYWDPAPALGKLMA